MSATNTTETSELCRQVEEELAEVIEGRASADLYDHIADCDACRDLRHEATKASALVRRAGADFRAPEGFEDRLIARLLEAPLPGAVEAPAASVKTLPGLATAPTELDALAAARSERSTGEAPVAKTVPPTTQPGEVTATTHHGPSASSAGPATEAVTGRPAPTLPANPTPIPAPKAAVSPRAGRSFTRRPAVMLGAAAVALAAGVGLYVNHKGAPQVAVVKPAPWAGSVSAVSRAGADATGGLESCDAKGACAPMGNGAAIAAGATLRTDARTRARINLADGTTIAIDRGSELRFSGGENRAAKLERGAIVADVAHVDGANARFAFPRGEVVVVGTKLALTAGDDRASVEVARGEVRLRGERGGEVSVRAGEEATLLPGQAPVVASASSLADVMEWSDDKPEEVDAPVLRGLGELRARRPGQTKEKDHAVRLAKHAVKVRVVDVVARTEVDETFANDTDEELEGIFRFPLPPGAQIEKLALEVDGKLMEGAFVDRDKGAAIWRGVIQNAAPKAPKPREEIFWVPGPWRDPALLEWQRGGRFELKIFPIPKHGSRRVVLAYTQTVDQAAGVRRFIYPLAHDPSGTTKVGSFDLDVQVLGLDPAIGLASRGYELVRASGEGERRVMHADSFVPAGDLTVEYALPDRDKEVTAWAYRAEPSAAAPALTAVNAPAGPPLTPQAGRRSSPPPAPTALPKTAEEKAAVEAAAAILDDTSPYVALAIRPKLPRWQEAKERLHVIVVDASRSMFGERFARASRLASSIVREMDRRDAFVLLACDTTCRSMSGEVGGASRGEAPGAAAVERVERFLGSVEPDGGSDLAAAVSAARAAASVDTGKELRILYLGDGTPTVGPTRPSHLEAAIRGGRRGASDEAIVAVALGADADTSSLAALARGGGGVVVPYVPGQKVAAAALDVLGAAYGQILRDPEIELPEGLRQVTPARLSPIRAGAEAIIVARMPLAGEVSGTMKLRGRVAGERFEQAYPLRIVATSGAGNAFVPRLYAAEKIAELEQVGGEAVKPTVIELSRRFSVASRATSLLVLESEAMLKAFGIERLSGPSAFTGEALAESSSADFEGEAKEEAEAADKAGDEKKKDAAFGPRAAATSAGRRAKGGDDLDAFADEPPASGIELGASGFGRGHGGGGLASPSPAPAAAQRSSPMPTFRPMFEKSEPSPPPPAEPKKVARETVEELSLDPWGAPARRRLVPMRKVFDRKLAFDGQNTFVAQNASKLIAAEGALASAPDSRDRTSELYALFATTGRIGEAQELTAKWSGRDALDPDALLARADLAARQGDRDRAARILGGVAEVRPTDRGIQTRLASLYETAGNTALACEHRLALADMAPGDAKLVADAVRCARIQGQVDLASALTLDAVEKVRAAVDRLLLAPVASAPGLVGDVQITAEWSGTADLDVALIDAQGKRTSWLGGPSKALISARDATGLRSETLALAGLPQGSYLLEVTRAHSLEEARNGGDPVRGEVTIRLAGEVRKVPFTITGARAEVGTVRVFFTSRLVPATDIAPRFGF